MFCGELLCFIVVQTRPLRSHSLASSISIVLDPRPIFQRLKTNRPGNDPGQAEDRLLHKEPLNYYHCMYVHVDGMGELSSIPVHKEGEN